MVAKETDRHISFLFPADNYAMHQKKQESRAKTQLNRNQIWNI